MNGPSGGNLTITLGPFNNPNQQVSGIDFVIHFNNNTWNNNNGADFHIPINNSPTSVDNNLRAKMSLWPVPAKDFVNVGISQELLNDHTLQLVSAQGEICRIAGVDRENFRLDLGGLLPGVYTLMIIDKHNQLKASSKLVKI